MKNGLFLFLFAFLLFAFLFFAFSSCGPNMRQPVKIKHKNNYNGTYSGERLNRIAFPIGGIGAGMICLEGTGAFSHVSVRNSPDVYNEPLMFAALSVKGIANGAKVLEGPVPTWKYFGSPNTANDGFNE